MDCLKKTKFAQNDREHIFQVADDIEEFGMNWKSDILKYFSTDELKDFFDDYARLRDFEIDWFEGIAKFSE